MPLELGSGLDWRPCFTVKHFLGSFDGLFLTRSLPAPRSDVLLPNLMFSILCQGSLPFPFSSLPYLLEVFLPLCLKVRESPSLPSRCHQFWSHPTSLFTLDFRCPVGVALRSHLVIEWIGERMNGCECSSDLLLFTVSILKHLDRSFICYWSPGMQRWTE